MKKKPWPGYLISRVRYEASTSETGLAHHSTCAVKEKYTAYEDMG
jgi:hypothetical protein